MKNRIIRWIYLRYINKFDDLMVEEYTKGIPIEVRNNLIDLLESQKDKFVRATDFMAYQLHRRMATDPKNSERYQGMFIQLKALSAMLKSTPDKKVVTQAQIERKEEKFDYSAAIAGALVKGKKSNAQG